MPRVGRHPLKDKSIKIKDPEIQRVTVTTITYIPMVAGYWQESLDVLKLFFESLYAHTLQPFDLMVFDNGSCDEVKSYLADLQKEGKIQYLIFSEQNLRKLGALDFLLSAAPGDYIAYADSDVYFLPGWLEESLKVLETFPEAVKVTALPMTRGDSSLSFEFKDATKDSSIIIKTGLLVPNMYVNAHRISLGQTKAIYDEMRKDRNDVILLRNGCEAVLADADFQFVITKSAAKAILPLQITENDNYGDPIYSPLLEHRLRAAGYWQLCTKEYYIHHMGNRIPDLKKELPWLKEDVVSGNHNSSKSFVAKGKYFENINKYFLKRSFIRKILKKIHQFSYRLLYEK